ncbi:Gfo/Idh/MocA family protein [Bacteroidota bacterium]
MDKKINVSVIGCGHLGRIHIKNLKEIEIESGSIKLSGVYDIDLEKCNSAADQFDVTVFNSFDDLLKNSNSIIVVTPTSTHFQIAYKAIEQNKNIFIEKPVTDDVNDARKLLAIAKGKEINIQVGHIERFNPALLSLEKYNLAPLFIETHRLAQFNPRGTDVSVVQDLMIHDIDVILNIVKSEVQSIHANGVAIITDKIDIANVRIKFDNGCVANITSSRISQNKMRKMRIFQRNAYISIDFLKNSSEVFRLVDSKSSESISPMFSLGTIKREDKDFNIVYEQPSIEEINPMKYELNKFFDCIRSGTEPVVQLKDGIQALEVATRINEEIELSSKDFK